MSRRLLVGLAIVTQALVCAGTAAAAVSSESWTEAQIRSSWTRTAAEGDLPSRPSWDADPLALFIVVERGGHWLALVDGERRKVVAHLELGRPVEGAPVISPVGRFVYIGSVDGWVSKIDLWSLRTVAEVRAGLVQRQIALSGDGHWLMVGNTSPKTLVLLDAQLGLKQVYAAASQDGKAQSAVAAVINAGIRSSFVVALESVPELWEISYDPQAEDIFDGMVHDYRMGEGVARPGYFGVRRSKLRSPMPQIWLDPSQSNVLGCASAIERRCVDAQVVNLDVRRRIARLPADIRPVITAAVSWPWQQRTVVALPDAVEPSLVLVDRQGWGVVKSIPTQGRVDQVVTHAAAPMVWMATAAGSGAEGALILVDKARLEIVRKVMLTHPARHIAFGLAGQTIAVATGDDRLVFYDAVTARELETLPMQRPSAAFNLGNTHVLAAPR